MGGKVTLENHENPENPGNKIIQKRKTFFFAYRNMKEMQLCLEKANQLNAYLISTKSIKKFISIIKDCNILNTTEDEKIDEIEQKLKNELSNNYDYEDLEIIHTSHQCENLCKQSNEEDNEFIIVAEKFINNMSKIIIEDLDKKQVKITLNKETGEHVIKCNDLSESTFKEKKDKGFYELLKVLSPTWIHLREANAIKDSNVIYRDVKNEN